MAQSHKHSPPERWKPEPSGRRFSPDHSRLTRTAAMPEAEGDPATQAVTSPKLRSTTVVR